MALPKTKIDATEARLAALRLPESGGWAQTARADAQERLRAMGLPDRRDEYWKYTRPDTLVQADAPQAAVFHNEEGPLYTDTDRLSVVFVDGVFDAETSDDLSRSCVIAT